LPWQFLLSTITTLASPRSFAVTDGRDLNNNNVFFDDFIGGTRTLRPDAGSFPNWYRTIDLRLARPLYTRGAQKYTLTLEVFNALNWNNSITPASRSFLARSARAGAPRRCERRTGLLVHGENAAVRPLTRSARPRLAPPCQSR
jgi:hypothetical protein